MTHQMTFEGYGTSGAEVWACPDCVHLMLVRWDPFKRTVVHYGDEAAVHIGCKGPVWMSAEVSQSLSAESRRWLADNGIDWDGGSERWKV